MGADGGRVNVTEVVLFGGRGYGLGYSPPELCVAAGGGVAAVCHGEKQRRFKRLDIRGENLIQREPDWDISETGVGFRTVFKLGVSVLYDKVFVDRDNPPFEIDVLGGKGQDFTTAEARIQAQIHKRPLLGSKIGLFDGGTLVGSESPFFFVLFFWKFKAACGVLQEHIVVLWRPRTFDQGCISAAPRCG